MIVTLMSLLVIYHKSLVINIGYLIRVRQRQNIALITVLNISNIQNCDDQLNIISSLVAWKVTLVVKWRVYALALYTI